MQKIDKKIVSYKVIDKTKEVTLPEELPKFVRHEREEVLHGRAYKIKPAGQDDSYYIIINNQIIDGIQRPMEIFINSKNVEHFQWIQLVTRLVSAIFRKGGDYSFIVEEFKAIHDPKGGYWGKDRITGKGIFYSSMLNEIGAVIDEHIRYTTGNIEEISIEPMELFHETLVENLKEVSEFPENAALCAKCSHKSVVILDGCATCLNCGDSKCG